MPGRTPEERRRAAEERARRRAGRDGDEPPPRTEPVPLEEAVEPLPSPSRRTAVAERPPMSRAARAQRVGRPGRPTLPARSPRPRRWFRRLFALLAMLFIGAALYAINATFQPFRGEDDQQGGVAVQIPDGADAKAIGKILEAKGVVDDARFFEINATLTFRRGDLRSGNYLLRRHMSNGAAIDALMQGPKVRVVRTFEVSIPEGRAIKESAPQIQKSGIEGNYLKATRSARALAAARDAGLPKSRKTLEGMLFPATYELKVGATAQALVDKQIAALDDNLDGLDLKAAKRKNLTRYDIVIIASLIERETASDKERPLIASVIYNRLKQGEPLGIDATIRYAEDNWTRPLRQSELERDGPYNTRLRGGLPPTPIGSAGLASLKAAAHPANTDFLFYVAKPGACHAFSSTSAEFERDVAAYNQAREANGGKAPDQKC